MIARLHDLILVNARRGGLLTPCGKRKVLAMSHCRRLGCQGLTIKGKGHALCLKAVSADIDMIWPLYPRYMKLSCCLLLLTVGDGGGL
jgi:hypothetical protein